MKRILVVVAVTTGIIWRTQSRCCHFQFGQQFFQFRPFDELATPLPRRFGFEQRLQLAGEIIAARFVVD